MECDFSSNQCVIKDKKAVVEEYKGKTALCIKDGSAYFENVIFENGVIECDIASPVNRSFLGIIFRMSSEDNFELIYFQPHTSGKWDAIQYDPVFNGSTTWQLHHGPGNQAEAVIPKETWIHVKIVVSGIQAKVFLDNSSGLVLVVNNLQHGKGKGKIGVWSYHPGNFANLTVQATDSLNNETTVEKKPDTNLLNYWQVTKPMLLKTLDISNLKRDFPLSVKAEKTGIINLNRYFKKPKGIATVFARVNIHSDLPQTKKLMFGYSDMISIFLNSKKIYSGDNSFGKSKQPGARGYVIDGEFSVTLDLQKGDNELLLAVSEDKFGWGFICSLENSDKLKVMKYK